MNKQRERQQTNSINKWQRVSRKKKSTLSNIAEVQNENREKAFGFGYFDFVSEDLWEDSFSEIIRAKSDKDFRRKCGDKVEVAIQILLLKQWRERGNWTVA